MILSDPANILEFDQRLSTLMLSIGRAVWDTQVLEETLATYLVLRVQAAIGIGRARGEELLKKAESRTMGALIKDLAQSGVLEQDLSDDLRWVLEERNWLVHRARRERRGVLSNTEDLAEVLQRLRCLSDKALELHMTLGKSLQVYVIKSGVDPDTINREAERIARSWTLIE